MSWFETLTEFAHQQLGEREREILWGRGVSDAQIDLYRLGCLSKRLPQEVLNVAPFAEWSAQGTKLDEVFVLPLTNVLNEVKGFQFRYIDRARKNYMDYMVGAEEPVLFGLGPAMPHIWAKKSAWLVEGGFDLFPVQKVYPQIISVMTAGVSEHIIKLLRRFVDDVYIAFDNDSAGRRGSLAFVKEYGREFRTHDIEFPKVKMSSGDYSKDPSDVWETWGDIRMKDFLQQLESPF